MPDADLGHALNWDDEIENDGNGFVLLAPGDYTFTVTRMERSYFNGSAKISACPQAELTLTIETPEGTANVRERLMLHTKMEWKISAFFRSIGLKKHGEKLVMPWNKVVGRQGQCRIVQDTFTGRNGEPVPVNRVDRFIDPPEEDAGEGDPPAAWTQGVKW